MSEILHYSVIRAGGILPTSSLPPGISEPFAPRFRPVRVRRPRRPSNTLVTLRRLAGRYLLRLGAMTLRLGQRWTAPFGQADGQPRLKEVC